MAAISTLLRVRLFLTKAGITEDISAVDGRYKYRSLQCRHPVASSLGASKNKPSIEQQLELMEAGKVRTSEDQGAGSDRHLPPSP